MSREGLLNWEPGCADSPPLCRPRFARMHRLVFAYPHVMNLVLVRLLAGLGMVAAPWAPPRILTAAVCAATVTGLLLSYRHRYGNDGADKMATISTVALALGYLGGSATTLSYSLMFIAFQLQLAYLTAGIAKLGSHHWRSGRALEGIMSTYTYGHHWFRSLLAGHRSLSQALSWSVMALLVGFVPMFLLGGRFLLAAMIGTALFHLSNALVMRLNTFVWSFLATYPALLYVRGQWPSPFG